MTNLNNLDTKPLPRRKPRRRWWLLGDSKPYHLRIVSKDEGAQELTGAGEKAADAMWEFYLMDRRATK